MLGCGLSPAFSIWGAKDLYHVLWGEMAQLHQDHSQVMNEEQRIHQAHRKVHNGPVPHLRGDTWSLNSSYIQSF